MWKLESQIKWEIYYTVNSIKLIITLIKLNRAGIKGSRSAGRPIKVGKSGKIAFNKIIPLHFSCILNIW